MAKEKKKNVYGDPLPDKPLHEWTWEELDSLDIRDPDQHYLQIAVMCSRFEGKEVPPSHVKAYLYEIFEELKKARYATQAAWRKNTHAG